MKAWAIDWLRWILEKIHVLKPEAVEIDIADWLPDEINEQMQQLPGESDEDHFTRAMAILQEWTRSQDEA